MMDLQFVVKVTALPWLPLYLQTDRIFYHLTLSGKYLVDGNV